MSCILYYHPVTLPSHTLLEPEHTIGLYHRENLTLWTAILLLECCTLMHIDNRLNYFNCSYVMCPVCQMRFVILSIKYYYYYI